MLLLSWRCFLVREVSDDVAGILVCLGAYLVPVAQASRHFPGLFHPQRSPSHPDWTRRMGHVARVIDVDSLKTKKGVVSI
jgi:hypothetical protein